MKKITTILLSVLILSSVPVQSNADSLLSRISKKVDTAFTAVKAKSPEINKSSEAPALTVNAARNTPRNSLTKGIDKLKYKVSYTKDRVKTVFREGLDMARSAMQSAFNMNFLSSVPVVFWKNSFDKMTDHVQKSVDDMNLEHKGELITRDDFQDDKALHIKKSAELALHIKSLLGSSVLAYGVTLAVGGMKEIIDGSFLNPNGGRCWEDFYADIVGASAVFGEKAFNKKFNKYMDSFLKENRKIDKVEKVEKEEVSQETISTETLTVIDEDNTAYSSEDTELNSCSDSKAELAQRKQKLTEAYYDAVKNGDTESIQRISEQLKALK